MPRFQKALAQLMGQEEGQTKPPREAQDGSGTIISELRTRVSAAELELISPFVGLFLQNTRLLEAVMPASEAASLTLGACRFLCDRHTSPLSLRVYVPTVSEHGWSSSHAVLEVATDDHPGLVTSICGVVEEQGGKIENLLGAAVHVERDETGLARSIKAAEGDSDERIMHAQVSSVGNLADLESTLRRHLAALGRSRRESGSLGDEVRRLADLLRDGMGSDREMVELLTWLMDGRLSVAGFEEIDARQGSSLRSLGTYAETAAGLTSTREATSNPDSLLVKTRARDPLHAGQFLDEIRVWPAGPASADPRLYRIAGTLGAGVFREPTSGVPVARELWSKVSRLLDASADRARIVFDRIPLDILLGTTDVEAAALVRAILAADEQPGVRIAITAGSKGADTCFATVIVPRQQLARSDAEPVGQLVRERLAPVLGRHFVSDDLAVVRLHYTLAAAAPRPEAVDEAAVELRRLLASWRDATPAEKPFIPADAAPIAAPPVEGAAGIELPDGVEVRAEGASGSRFVVRVAADPAGGALNDILVTLGHLGLRIVQHEAAPATSTSLGVLEIAVEADRAADPHRIASLLREVRAGAIVADALLSLCWRTGLDTATVDVLRAFCALAEARRVAERAVVSRALLDNPDAAEHFVRAFEVRFDPRLPVANDGQRRRDFEAARERFDAATTSTGRASRRVLQQLGELLAESVRTSFFCGDRRQAGRAIALKLRSSLTAGARYETFVCAPGFEGVLLRGGPAARAVLLLCEEFASLHSRAARELAEQSLRAGHVSTDPGCAILALRGEGVAREAADRALREFLDTLLDVTDDVVDGELHRNPAVVVHDEADSYFAVAVGERPSGWVEVARRAVLERRFWMADAAVARVDERVAAEGAWSGLETLLTAAGGRSPSAPRDGEAGGDDILTVVAIGSPHDLYLPPGVRLLAAFDDHEIFLAPEIDAASCAKGLAELSRRGRSSWADFPVDLRGRGGAVIRRDARKIELSEQVASLLEWTEGGGGDELARAVLAIDVDLLWVRGSSVRASGKWEMSGRSADRLEVEADRISADTVAEIGFALFSPAARVEFALSGRTVHTPVLDGMAADVVADRVSNIELALSFAGPNREAVETQSAEVAAEIRRAAMEAPRRHVVAIALDQKRSREDWPAAAACIRRLREAGDVTEIASYVGSDLELARRQGESDGLTRSEIAVLRSAISLRLQRAVSASSLCKDPYLRPWIDDYFPGPISHHFPDLVDQHPLRDEIASLAVAERLLDVMGFAFVSAAAEVHGRPDLDIVKAWTAVFIFGGAQEVWTEIEGAGLAPGSVGQTRHRLAIAAALGRATDRLIELRAVDLSLERMIDRFGGAVAEILRSWPESLPESRGSQHEGAIEAGVQSGLPREAADHLARIVHLDEIVDICDLAIQINSPRSAVAASFLGLDPVFRFGEIDVMVQALRDHDLHWGARAAAHLRARLSAARRGLTTDVVASAAGRRRPVERWVDTHGDDVRVFQRLLGEVKSRGQASGAAVEVLIGALENLARGPRRAR